MLGKGLSHGARQVDAVVIPFERAAKAARDAMPDDPAPDPVPDLADVPEADAEQAARDDVMRRPQPGRSVATPVASEDLMRLAADAGLIRHVEAVCALSRRAVRLVPADPAEVAGRSRLGGAPDLPMSAVWPNWDAAPLTFVGQIDLAEAAAAGIDEALPPDGLLLIFSALEQTPSGSSPMDRESSRVLYVEEERIPPVTPDPIGAGRPEAARAVEITSELTIPRVWTAPVQALGLDDAEQGAWEQVRRELAELQGVTLWDDGAELHASHRLLGYPEETRGDMQLACELAARGIDVGYGAPSAHPDARGLDGVAQRWRLLLQLTIDDDAGWRFGRGRERLWLWGPEDELADGVMAHVRGIAR
ncbi:Protein of unknown function DUF1963 [Conexibacter woesei DSM 14684]|uniref:DUF1963 domain-containing protein n=2 Tax=Conexibacter TaxID=191494 RepID=D3F3H9_CONWI|nr:Protein of unknown function DUF1963 [Conexibacter woesei DSM 14684]